MRKALCTALGVAALTPLAAHAQSAAPRHAARNRKSSERVVMIASLKIGGTPIS